jgi:hypothetical protein
MAEKDYVLQAYPVSLLPSTPAGRLQAVTELVQNGVIQRREHIIRLLDFPDLESVTSLYDALERDVEWRISEILEESKYHAPETMMDLVYAKERMTIAYLEAEQDGLELDKLNMMLQFIDECDALMQQGQEAAPEAPGEEAAAAAPEMAEEIGLEGVEMPAGMETPMTETIDAAMPQQEGLPI